MIDTKAIRARVLDLAVRGRLVEQRPEEGTGSILYDHVLEERNRQENAGIIKVLELLADVGDSESPFDIPKNWRWARFGNVTYIMRGGSPRPIKEYITDREDGINWIKIGDVEKGGKYIWSTKEKIIPEGESKSRHVYPGDFLLTNSMSFGRPYITKIDGCIHDGWLLIHDFEGFDQNFLYFLLSSPFMYNQFAEKASGSTVQNLNIDRVKSAIVPLPPLAEQKRIVEKVEVIFAALDEIDAAQTRFGENAGALKTKLLDLAVRGKLVEQRPEEGTGEALYQQIQAEKQALIKAGKLKKEKPLPEITEDDKPFEIPEGWKWVRFGSVITLLSGTDFKPEEYNDQEKGTPYITGASSLSNTGVLVNRWTETPRIIAEYGDVLLVCKGAGYGKTVICDIDRAHIARQIMAIKKTGFLDMQYVMAFLKGNLQKIKVFGQGVIPGIDRASVLSMVFPLPPLAEQKRIVAKLEELLPLCAF